VILPTVLLFHLISFLSFSFTSLGRFSAVAEYFENRPIKTITSNCANIKLGGMTEIHTQIEHKFSLLLVLAAACRWITPSAP
jgi:hypothetical protein